MTKKLPRLRIGRLEISLLAPGTSHTKPIGLKKVHLRPRNTVQPSYGKICILPIRLWVKKLDRAFIVVFCPWDFYLILDISPHINFEPKCPVCGCRLCFPTIDFSEIGVPIVNNPFLLEFLFACVLGLHKTNSQYHIVNLFICSHHVGSEAKLRRLSVR
jgi:hypothetical protein